MNDLIIVGGGPAGLTASIYASCFHLKHLVISLNLGGQMLLAPDILNYPGFNNISGVELTERMVNQAKLRGGEVISNAVVKIGKQNSQENHKDKSNENTSFTVETQDGKKFQTRAIILATGTERKKLGVPGEIEYTARGVHYCATCEKFDYEGKICAVVGGANSAVQAAVELAQAASKVYIIYRGDKLRGDPIWLSQIENNSKIKVLFNTAVTEILGDGKKVTGLKIKSTKQENEKPVADLLKLDKIFIEIGGVPGTALVIPLGVIMDHGGYIKVDDKLATNVPGIFAAGDLVSYGLSIEQISSAVGLGARAASSVFAFLEKEKAPTLWGSSHIKR